jgi:hypothetical protein
VTAPKKDSRPLDSSATIIGTDKRRRGFRSLRLFSEATTPLLVQTLGARDIRPMWPPARRDRRRRNNCDRINRGNSRFERVARVGVAAPRRPPRVPAGGLHPPADAIVRKTPMGVGLPKAEFGLWRALQDSWFFSGLASCWIVLLPGGRERIVHEIVHGGSNRGFATTIICSFGVSLQKQQYRLRQ